MRRCYTYKVDILHIHQSTKTHKDRAEKTSTQILCGQPIAGHQLLAYQVDFYKCFKETRTAAEHDGHLVNVFLQINKMLLWEETCLIEWAPSWIAPRNEILFSVLRGRTLVTLNAYTSIFSGVVEASSRWVYKPCRGLKARYTDQIFASRKHSEHFNGKAL